MTDTPIHYLEPNEGYFIAVKGSTFNQWLEILKAEHERDYRSYSRELKEKKDEIKLVGEEVSKGANILAFGKPKLKLYNRHFVNPPQKEFNPKYIVVSKLDSLEGIDL